MKRLLLVLLVALALVATAFVAPLLVDDPGRVQLEIGPWHVEASLLVLVGAVILTWVLLSIIVGLARMPGRLVRRGRENRSRRQLEKGFLALTEGDWVAAERALGKSLRHQSSTAGYLAAARAAQGQGDEAGRDRWLALADRRYGRKHFVTGLARVRLLLAEGRGEEAVAILERLHLSKPRHTGVLRLLLEVYQDLQRWRDLRLLVPALRRGGVIDRERAVELTAVAAGRELALAVDIDALESSWKELPRKLRKRADLVAAYARRAAELGRVMIAGDVLERKLAEGPDDVLLALYAHADEGERAHRIRRCEQWLAEHPDDPGLQESLGLLYLEDRQYDKARACLERVVRERPSSEAYAALGRVLDREGKLEAAAQCYRNALRLRDGRGAEPLAALVGPDK